MLTGFDPHFNALTHLILVLAVHQVQMYFYWTSWNLRVADHHRFDILNVHGPRGVADWWKISFRFDTKGNYRLSSGPGSNGLYEFRG